MAWRLFPEPCTLLLLGPLDGDFLKRTLEKEQTRPFLLPHDEVGYSTKEGCA
jgi:hypothetical protein